MVKAQAKSAQALIQCLFAGVAKGRVADIVRQRQRLGEVFVQLEDPRQGARNLGYLNGVGEPVAEVIREAR